jgi:hypothetical protein
VPGGPGGYPWPLGAAGRILVQKCAMLYQSNIFFEKLLYGLFRKKNKMCDLLKIVIFERDGKRESFIF